MMKRKIICILLVNILLLTIPTTTTSLEASPPDLLDQACTSGNSYQSKNPPLGILSQKITTSVMFITKFEVKLSRSGTEDDCLIALGLYCDGAIQRVKTIIFNDIPESGKWYSCTFNDLENEDENKQPYVVEDLSDLSIKVFFVGGSLGSDAEIRWHGDSNNPYEEGEAIGYDNFDFNFKTYGYSQSLLNSN